MHVASRPLIAWLFIIRDIYKAVAVLAHCLCVCKRSRGKRRSRLLHGVEEDRIILRTIKRRKADWIGHILRRNCRVHVKYVIEEKDRGKGRSDARARKKTEAATG